MSLNQPPPHDNEHSAQPNGHAEHDDRKRAMPDSDFWTKCPVLAAFIRDHSLHTSSFRRIVRRVRQQGGYWYEETAIRITRDRKVEFLLDDVQPKDDAEKQQIADEVRTADLPTSSWAFCLSPELEKLPPSSLYVCRTQHERGGLEPIKQGENKENRHSILFALQRIDLPDGEKLYLPWSYWNDEKWRRMEPDGDLPLYGLERLNGATKVYVHEGAKAARAAQEIADGLHPDHPLTQELAGTVHLGWLGGALNPGRTDWGPLKTLPRDVHVTVIADNDTLGVDAVPVISRTLERKIKVVRFNGDFEDGFDLADDWPQQGKDGRAWWTTTADGRDIERREYKGPTLADLTFPATWMTDLVALTANRSVIRLREAAKTEWFYATDAEQLIHRDTGRIMTVPIFDARMGPFSHPSTKRLSEHFKSVLSAQIDLPAFRPDRPNGDLFTEGGKMMCSIHRGSNIRPKKGSTKLFEDYLTYLIPDDHERLEVKRWVATLVARPGTRMGYGLLLFSKTQGVGKTTLGQDVLAPIIGEHNVSYPSESAIVSDSFNAWLANVRLAICNEIYSGHSSKAYNNLKSYVTDKNVTVNQKHEKAYIIENWAHFIACSNSSRALQIQDEDRRFLVVHCVEAVRGHKDWCEFFAYLEDGGLAHIAWWAHEFLKTNDPVPRGTHAPMTNSKKEMIEDQQSPGMKRMFALGETIKEMIPKKKVVVVNDALKWALADVDQRFESSEKVTSMLLKAGLMEQRQGGGARRFKVRGMRTRLFANFPITSDMTWDGKDGKDKLSDFELKREEYPMF